MQISLLFLLLDIFVTKTFQNNVRFLWFVETDHIDFLGVYQFDGFGEKDFTDFALEFREVVSGGNTNNFLFDFTEHPVFEATDMNERTAALAVAWVD